MPHVNFLGSYYVTTEPKAQLSGGVQKTVRQYVKYRSLPIQWESRFASCSSRYLSLPQPRAKSATYKKRECSLSKRAFSKACCCDKPRYIIAYIPVSTNDILHSDVSKIAACMRARSRADVYMYIWCGVAVSIAPPRLAWSP